MSVSRTVTLAMMVLLPTAALAQGDPPAPTVGQPAKGAQTSGRPANLCQELLAFVHQPDAAKKAGEPPPQLATAVSAKKQDDSSAKPSAEGTPQNTSGQAGQITSSGPGAAGPQGATQNAAAPTGSTATAGGPTKDAPQSSPSGPAQPTAKTAPAEPSAPKPTAENVQQVEAAAANNDLQGCRAMGQQMRRAGVAMPAPLIALSAMDPKLLGGAQRP
jgi:hypothetical protein